MKRVLTILAILLLPLSVWAMTPVTDSDLSNVTGQAGVNINADLTMNISIGTMAWGDNDGVYGVYMPWATQSNGGYIGITGFNINNLKVRARTDITDSYNSYNTLLLKPITIDVATSNGSAQTAGGAGTIANGTTYVRFGLGALQINMDALQFDVALGSHAATGYIGVSPTLNQNLGVVSIGGMGIYINPWSYVDIYNSHGAGTSGVTFAFNVIIDRFTMDYMSWGDHDGVINGTGSLNNPTANFKWIGTVNSAGYVGLNNFKMGNDTSPAITITGAVAIDVLSQGTTATNSVYASLPTIMDEFKTYMKAHGLNPTSEAQVAYALHSAGMDPASGVAGIPINTILSEINSLTGVAGTPAAYSMVHISFPVDFDMTVNSMWADVQLASTFNLGGTVSGGGAASGVGELGDIYISGMHLNIKTGSWVDIWAH